MTLLEDGGLAELSLAVCTLMQALTPETAIHQIAECLKWYNTDPDSAALLAAMDLRPTSECWSLEAAAEGRMELHGYLNTICIYMIQDNHASLDGALGEVSMCYVDNITLITSLTSGVS